MAAASTPSKQLAALRGELDSLVCKVSGYERALQDVEMQLAERDLQVALLKSCISADASTGVLQQQVLNRPDNTRWQAPLQPLPPASTHCLSHPDVAAGSAATTAAAALQVSLLRSALAEANYRLAAAGLLPVTATTATPRETSSTQGPADLASLAMTHTDTTTPSSSSKSNSSTPFSRLFRSKYGTSMQPAASAYTNNTTCSSSSTSTAGGKAGVSPCAPALTLVSKPSSVGGAASPADCGPDTPVGLDSSRHHHQAASGVASCRSQPPSSNRLSSFSPACTPQVARSASPSFESATAACTAARTAHTAASPAAAAVSRLESEFVAVAAAGASDLRADGSLQLAGLLSASESAEEQGSLRGSYSSSNLSQTSPRLDMVPTEQLPAHPRVYAAAMHSSSCAGPDSLRAEPSSSPGRGMRVTASTTPLCSPCSSISSSGEGCLLSARRSYGGPANRLPVFADVLRSCDNPLFAAEDQAAVYGL